MATGRADTLLRHIRTLAACATDDLPDRELVRRFAARRNEAAFEALLHCHGPTVLSVCRRVLRNLHDAEDAFQATFLVFARKAASLRAADSVGSWLYGVAYRLALKARTSAARRREHEGRLLKRPPTDPLEEVSVREAQAVLDEELARLPGKYRAPLVLCCLEGLARDEAAQQLGWPAGLLKSRLEQARELLRRRLARRGLVLAVPLLAAALAEPASAAVPAALAATTVRAALPFAAGGAAAASARATALAQGALLEMFLTRLRAAAAVLLVLATAAAGAGLLARQAAGRADDPGPEPAARGAAPAEKPEPRRDHYGDPLPAGALARAGTLRLWHGTQFTAL